MEVLVPVPEDLVDQVRQFVVWKLHSPEEGVWGRDVVTEAMANLDDVGRHLLIVASRAMLDEEPLTVADAAARLHISTRELRGIVLEIGFRFTSAGGPLFSVVLLNSPDGMDDDRRIVAVPLDLARLVVTNPPIRPT